MSATTRTPRPGERNGRDYLFLSHAQFAALAAEGQFLEWASFAYNSYGTPRAAVVEHLAHGPVLLEIELQGARQVRAAMPECVLVFLAPPGPEELKRRPRGPGPRTRRPCGPGLARAEEELAAQGEFDHVVRNVDVDQASAELSALIE